MTNFFERPAIHDLKGYAAGDQPSKPVPAKLNTNENPYPPAAAVMDALHHITDEMLRRYPSPSAAAFRQCAAAVHGVSPNNIIATNGGDELLRLAITTFVEPTGSIGLVNPTYSLYRVLGAIHGSTVHEVELNLDWTLPDNFAEEMREANVSLIILANPHAPSGYLLPLQELQRLADTVSSVVLIDEAYVDFIDPELKWDSIRLICEHENVLLLRTLSKGYSLAGLRFGYGIGSPSLITPMSSKAKDSYNVDVVAQTLAIAALNSMNYARESWRRVRAERNRIKVELARLGIHCPESRSNFLLATIPSTIKFDARALYERLRTEGILVRYFDAPRLTDKLRITIGRPEENDLLLAAFRCYFSKS